jgi:hypothetical protein
MSDGELTEAPTVVATATEPPLVCRCGSGPHATHVGICTRGHALPLNQLRRTHGAYSFRDRGVAALPDVLRQTVDEFRESVIADRGGPSALSTLDAAYIRRLAEVETVARLLANDLASRGLTTPTGRVRGTFSRWLECLDRWDRLAQRVGTDRKTQPISLAARLAAVEPIASTAECADGDQPC